MHSLHLKAIDYGHLPSEILGIESPIVAYAFDKWCNLYGRKVDNLLAQRKEIKKGKQVIGDKPKYDYETALAKAANDKRQRLRGLAPLFAMLDEPGAPKKIILTG